MSRAFVPRVATAQAKTIALAALVACSACEKAEALDARSHAAESRPRVSAEEVLPGAWQAGPIQRFQSAKGSRRTQQVDLGGGGAGEPVIETMDEAMAQASLRSVFESSRWVLLRDGTFEVRSYEGHVQSGRIIGRYAAGTAPWTIQGEGRTDNQVGDESQRMSASITYQDHDSLVLSISFDCTVSDASLGSARAVGGWGTAWSFQLSGTFELPLHRGIHEPGLGNALVLASRPIPLEQPTYVPTPTIDYDSTMTNAQALLESTDRSIANAKAKQIFDHGFWELHPNGTFRYTHDPLHYYPLHELRGTWWSEGEATLRYSGMARYTDGALATTASIEGELVRMDGETATARLIYRSDDGFSRYQHAFEQSYRVDQRMGE